MPKFNRATLQRFAIIPTNAQKDINAAGLFEQQAGKNSELE
jgi:hypothetical protein